MTSEIPNAESYQLLRYGGSGTAGTNDAYMKVAEQQLDFFPKSKNLSVKKSRADVLS